MNEERVAPLLVDVREAARLLGCGRTFVYGMIERGELPVVKLGRLTRIPVIGLEALVIGRVAPAVGVEAAEAPYAGPTPRRRRRP
ncbi:MAG TPA: helix-turn-helix domain-containing protein [Verrucomicrobiae bacterium]|nr:helix-turn-helix domain-containing protein [Verrucomicrobiae bacterium]